MNSFKFFILFLFPVWQLLTVIYPWKGSQATGLSLAVLLDYVSVNTCSTFLIIIILMVLMISQTSREPFNFWVVSDEAVVVFNTTADLTKTPYSQITTVTDSCSGYITYRVDAHL